LDRNKRRIRNYLGYLIYLLPIAIIILAYVGIIVVTGESQPFTVVSGPSMQPTILSGTIVMIAKTPFSQLKVNDVIVFTPIAALQGSSCQSNAPSSLSQDALNPCYVIHRIVNISTNAQGQEILTTSGDHNDISTDPCMPSAPRSIQGYDCDINSSMYVGQVVLLFPLLGYLTQRPYNYYLAAVIALILILDLFYFEQRQQRKK
jgi:signal peptidase I